MHAVRLIETEQKLYINCVLLGFSEPFESDVRLTCAPELEILRFASMLISKGLSHLLGEQDGWPTPFTAETRLLED